MNDGWSRWTTRCARTSRAASVTQNLHGGYGLEVAVDVEWAEGGILLSDHVRVGHGRRPFAGDRRVLVAMSD